MNHCAINALFCLAWDRTTGRVGPPVSSTEIKLVSWEEGLLAMLVLYLLHTIIFVTFERLNLFECH